MEDRIPIIQLQPGDRVRVVSFAEMSPQHIRKLVAFGLLPGVEVQILQNFPVYVLAIGYTQLALDVEIAKNIHCSSIK